MGGVYLFWHGYRRVLWLGPVVLATFLLISPGSLGKRLESMTRPDAYSARLIMWRTGVNMVQAHPWFGLGPMRVGPRFSEFQPEDIAELPPAYYDHLHNVFIHYAAERGYPGHLASTPGTRESGLG